MDKPSNCTRPDYSASRERSSVSSCAIDSSSEQDSQQDSEQEDIVLSFRKRLADKLQLERKSERHEETELADEFQIPERSEQSDESERTCGSQLVSATDTNKAGSSQVSGLIHRLLQQEGSTASHTHKRQDSEDIRRGLRHQMRQGISGQLESHRTIKKKSGEGISAVEDKSIESWMKEVEKNKLPKGLEEASEVPIDFPALVRAPSWAQKNSAAGSSKTQESESSQTQQSESSQKRESGLKDPSEYVW